MIKSLFFDIIEMQLKFAKDVSTPNAIKVQIEKNGKIHVIYSSISICTM